MMYSYLYTTFGRGLVATFDLSVKNLGLFHNDHRLRSRKNVTPGSDPPSLAAPRAGGDWTTSKVLTDLRLGFATRDHFSAKVE